MKEKLKISAALALTLSGIFLLRSVAPAAPGQGAAVYMVDNVTIQSLHSLYDSPAPSDAKVKVFVMPGHEPDYGGAEYRDVKERDLNLVIGEYLKGFLENDSHYDVTLGRDENGWNPDIAAYFKDHAKDIAAWHDDQKKIMAGLVDSGEVKVDRDPAIHQVVPDDVAMRLYGLNKWIGENKFDIALHIHINDYGTRPGNSPGEFSGYVIYEPYHQYSNSAAAAALASALKTRLDTVIARSDAPKEAAGVVEDQQLIALGRYNTADTPSLLIEYGYIYEPQFQTAAARDAVLKEYAYQTYLGIRDFFASSTASSVPLETAALPHEWASDPGSAPAKSDLVPLQLDLLKEGLYPPAGKSLHECPISGMFGPCAKSALSAFQKKYGIDGESGVLGNRTRVALDLAAARTN